MKREDEEDNKLWRILGLASSLGWMVALPIIAGVLLGRYLDDKAGYQEYKYIWTLSLMVVGIFIGVYNLYRTYIDTGMGENKEKGEEIEGIEKKPDDLEELEAKLLEELLKGKEKK